MSTAYPAILFVLLTMAPIFGLLQSPRPLTMNVEERARSSVTKTVSIFTKMGLTDTVVNNLILVNSTKLSYGVGAIIGTLFLTAALYENGIFGSDITTLVDPANQVLAADGRLGLAAANRADHSPTFSTNSWISSVQKEKSNSQYSCNHFPKGSHKRRKR